MLTLQSKAGVQYIGGETQRQRAQILVRVLPKCALTSLRSIGRAVNTPTPVADESKDTGTIVQPSRSDTSVPTHTLTTVRPRHAHQNGNRCRCGRVINTRQAVDGGIWIAGGPLGEDRGVHVYFSSSVRHSFSLKTLTHTSHRHSLSHHPTSRMETIPSDGDQIVYDDDSRVIHIGNWTERPLKYEGHRISWTTTVNDSVQFNFTGA